MTTASVTLAVSMAPANSPGSATARRDGVGSSAIRVSSQDQWNITGDLGIALGKTDTTTLSL